MADIKTLLNSLDAPASIPVLDELQARFANASVPVSAAESEALAGDMTRFVLKRCAKHLRKHMRHWHGIDLKSSQALEAISAALGFANWNVASAVMPRLLTELAATGLAMQEPTAEEDDDLDEDGVDDEGDASGADAGGDAGGDASQPHVAVLDGGVSHRGYTVMVGPSGAGKTPALRRSLRRIAAQQVTEDVTGEATDGQTDVRGLILDVTLEEDFEPTDSLGHSAEPSPRSDRLIVRPAWQWLTTSLCSTLMTGSSGTGKTRALRRAFELEKARGGSPLLALTRRGYGDEEREWERVGKELQEYEPDYRFCDGGYEDLEDAQYVVVLDDGGQGLAAAPRARMEQCLAWAKGHVHHRPVLFLDEPEMHFKECTEEFLSRLPFGVTVIWSSHALPELSRSALSRFGQLVALMNDMSRRNSLANVAFALGYPQPYAFAEAAEAMSQGQAISFTRVRR